MSTKRVVFESASPDECDVDIWRVYDDNGKIKRVIHSDRWVYEYDNGQYSEVEGEKIGWAWKLRIGEFEAIEDELLDPDFDFEKPE